MIDGPARMKQIGEAAAKAARHRKFHWCRRPNGFSDMPLWGVVADKLAIPLYQVVAFANRLEELGNAAANFGETRGNVLRFSAPEFAKALGMSADDAARIYAALEDPDVGWIAYDHVADFYSRNPDREDEGAAERQRRKRLRDVIRAQLSKLSRLGKIDERERRAIEEVLGGTEAELRNLQAKLSAAELSTASDVTRDIRDISRPESGQKKLSTAETVTRDSRMSQRDSVTVTPEQSREVRRDAVDNFGEVTRGNQSGLAGKQGDPAPEVEAATIWLATDGRRMLVDFMQIRPALAETYLERWRRDIQDDLALVAIVKGAEEAGYIGARFHTIVTEQLKRHVAKALYGPPLPLMPPRPGTQRKESA